MNKTVVILLTLVPFSVLAHPGHDGIGGSIEDLILGGLILAASVGAAYGLKQLLAKREPR